MIRKLKREVEDEVEDFFERLSDQIDADEPRLKYRHDWTQEYQKTVIDVDFDRDSRTDLTVILEGQHFLTVEHG
jgi:hypothetical protein